MSANKIIGCVNIPQPLVCGNVDRIEFAQVGSASDSTEIAADGQEVDVFYNDGVNWAAGTNTPAHECFAGYSGLATGIAS